MRILILHNRYQQPGGEDAVVRAEMALLRSHGHQVALMEEANGPVRGIGEKIATALRCIYSPHTYRAVSEQIRSFRPDLVHIHNFFPRLSPAAHYACKDARLPVVQTLHNFRLLCPGATLCRDGRLCESCRDKAFAWPAVAHRCYRHSRWGSAAVATMNLVHRLLRTWQKTVTVLIAPSECVRQQFVEAGFSSSKIAVKPNFAAEDPGIGSGNGGFALYVGRLSAEKGIATLLDAWQRVPPGRVLRIAGDGPLSAMVQSAAGIPGIEWLGTQPHEEILRLMRQAAFLIFPSACYETFGLALAEAFSAGLPVIGSRLGAIAEIVTDDKTGLLFPPGDAAALADRIAWAFDHPQQLHQMRSWARSEYESAYTPAANYSLLMKIYEQAVRLGTTAP